MIDQDLVQKLQILKEIKPRKDWVILTKNQILGEEKLANEFNFSHFLQYLRLSYKIAYKPVLISLTVLAVFAGTFVLAQDSLPGDALYSLKRITEKTQAIFVSEEEKPQASLELVNKRLEELTKIAESNQSQKLSSAMSELQINVSQAVESLAKIERIDKRIVSQTQKVEVSKKRAEQLLATQFIETEELDNIYQIIAEREINNLENSSLTEFQEEVLIEIKEDFEAGNYIQALEQILLITNLPN